MLRTLYIKNIALITTQTFEFDAGFNVLSGETGAGKSIIVDSLMLILGSKFDKNLIRYGEEFARVEAEFDTTPEVEKLLAELDIDVEDTTVITRKITALGKSENRINGRTVTLSAIKEIGNLLVDICGQNEFQYLSNVSNHIKLLDYFVRSDIQDPLAKYRENLSKLKEINKKLNEIGEIKDRDENIEFLKKQLRTIQKADVKEGEEEELLALKKKYQYSEKIQNALKECDQVLSGANLNALALVEEGSRFLSSISAYDEEYGQLSDRLESVLTEIEDISETVADKLGEFDFSASDVDELEDRLAKIKELTRKYGSVDGIKRKEKELEEKISFLENSDALYEGLTIDKNKLVKDLYALAVSISNFRRKGAKIFEQKVLRELADLGMSNSAFEIVFDEIPTLETAEKSFTSNGLDSVEFYLSPNVGQPLKPLTKIISGGEQSRFMLAIKVVSGDTDYVPTLIFDEIDVGISGKIGLEVAKKMATISTSHQVLSVTHLPQICAMADQNYFISKSAQNGTTVTSVTLLDYDGQVDEIARLSGSKDISDRSTDSAKEMKEWANNYKIALRKTSK